MGDSPNSTSGWTRKGEKRQAGQTTADADKQLEHFRTICAVCGRSLYATTLYVKVLLYHLPCVMACREAASVILSTAHIGA